MQSAEPFEQFPFRNHPVVDWRPVTAWVSQLFECAGMEPSLDFEFFNVSLELFHTACYQQAIVPGRKSAHGNDTTVAVRVVEIEVCHEKAALSGFG